MCIYLHFVRNSHPSLSTPVSFHISDRFWYYFNYCSQPAATRGKKIISLRVLDWLRSHTRTYTRVCHALKIEIFVFSPYSMSASRYQIYKFTNNLLPARFAPTLHRFFPVRARRVDGFIKKKNYLHFNNNNCEFGIGILCAFRSTNFTSKIMSRFCLSFNDATIVRLKSFHSTRAVYRCYIIPTSKFQNYIKITHDCTRIYA